MLPQELESYIDAALLDGIVDEQERNTIYKKATSLGIDKDEVDLFLNAKIHELKPKSNKVGSIKKCPACGEAVTAMSLNCASCNHEFNSTGSNTTILDLVEKLSKIQDDEFDEEGDKLIKNFPIPNNKEDIIEFLTFSISKTSAWSSMDEGPWLVKAEEAIMKSKLLFKNDLDMLGVINGYEKKLKTRKRSGVLIIVGIIVFLFGIAGTVIFVYG